MSGRNSRKRKGKVSDLIAILGSKRGVRGTRHKGNLRALPSPQEDGPVA